MGGIPIRISKNIGVYGELIISQGGFLECLERLFDFRGRGGGVIEKNSKTKTGLHAAIKFSHDSQCGSPISLEAYKVLLNYY